MITIIKDIFPPEIYKSLLVDLEDIARASALKAHEMVRDHAGLNIKRSRELEGQARFRMTEERFQEICELYGGCILSNGIVPETNLKVFQPFMRFEHENRGAILGLATMPVPSALPTKNKSRKSGVVLNYHLQPSLDLEGTGAELGDIFILFLVSRDKQKAGLLEEIAIGVISAGYDQFLFYETLEQFLGGTSISEHGGPPSPVAPPTLRLKPNSRPYIPPELPEEKKEDHSNKK